MLRRKRRSALHNPYVNNPYVNQVRHTIRGGRAVVLSDAEPVLTIPNQDERLELRGLERALVKLPEEQRAALLLVGMESMRYDRSPP
jgi:DNA-directed RNA polymerase specialized sigma24 family protein